MIEGNREGLRDDVAICQGVIGRGHGVEFPWTVGAMGRMSCPARLRPTKFPLLR